MDQPRANENLFTVLERGDVKIMQAKRKAIILVGITRAGKSTTFNWILKKPLIGKGKLRYTFYEVVQDDSETAELAFGYTSVTLDPNICSTYTLKNSNGKEEQVSLIDMAGFCDSRDYVGVIGVSYFLKTIFQQVREVKFVIVFDQTRLMEGTGQGIIQTFYGLINMFHVDLMTPAVKKQFLQSLCLVVTKSREGHNHRQYLESTVQQLQNQELNVANKKLIIEMITHIIKEGKMEDFAAAAKDRLAQSCSFVQRFTNERDWNYFNLDQAKKLLSYSLQDLPKQKNFQQLDEQQKQHFRKAIKSGIKEIIKIPFQKDFKALNLQQTKKFRVTIQEKVKLYQDFSIILSTLIKVFQQNWQKMLEKQNTTGVVEPNYFKVNEMFQKVKQFLSKNDVYSSSTKIQFSLEGSFQKIGLAQAIKQILLIYEQVDRISSKDIFDDSFQEAMKRFSTEFSSLVDCLKAFALKVEEENNLDRLKYVLNRGFRQFSKLYQLQPTSIHDIKQKLPDNLNQVFFEGKRQFLERFIIPMNENLLSKLFTTIPQLQQYEQLFSKYEFENQQFQDKLFFSKHWYTLEMSKADLYFRNSQKGQALLCFIRALRRLCETCHCVTQSSTMQNYEIEDELKKLWMKKLRLLKKIIKILSNLPQNVNFSPKIYALQLCEHHNMLDETAEVYDLIIDSSSLSRQEKANYYEYYANFCAKWGEVEKAIRLLKKKLSLEDEDYERYMQTVNLIKQMIQGKANYIKQTNQLFASWKNVPETDSVLLEKLEDIQNLISKL